MRTWDVDGNRSIYQVESQTGYSRRYADLYGLRFTTRVEGKLVGLYYRQSAENVVVVIFLRNEISAAETIQLLLRIPNGNENGGVSDRDRRIGRSEAVAMEENMRSMAVV